MAHTMRVCGMRAWRVWHGVIKWVCPNFLPVNDLGRNMHGEGKSSARPADEVVSIIKSKGGTAVPNYGMLQ